MGLLADYLPSLPTDPNQNDAARQGLLAFGAAMLGGRGNFGQILGGGLAAGAGGYNSALQALQQKALQDAQTKHYTIANESDQAALDQNKAISAGLANFNSQQAPGAAASLVTNQAQAPATPAPLSSTPQASPAPDAGLPLSMFPQANAAPAQPVVPVSSLPQVGDSAPDPYADYKAARARAIYLNNNFPGSPQATAALKAANDLKPKFSTEFRVGKGADGLLHNYLVSEEGYTKDSGIGVKPNMKSTDLGGVVRWDDENALQPGQTFTKTVTPGEQLQHQDQVATRAQADRHWKAEQENKGDDAPLSDDAILNAAARYNVDGTLPPMGMGKNAAAGRSKILNKAAELKYGVDPEQQRRDQLANKGDVASQNAAIKAFTSGKQGNSVRSFNVALSHIDTLDRLTDAMGNGDTQALNRLGNYFAKQTGQAAPTSFEAVKHIVGDEIVKAVTGSAGALGDREAAAKTIAAANSPAQLKAVMANYKELMRGQLDGLRQQYETSTGRNDFDRFLSAEAKGGHGAKPVVKDLKDVPKTKPAASGVKFLGYE